MEGRLSSDGIARAELLAEARSWIGTPYRHQASLKGVGCDCLGLVRGLWRQFVGPEPVPVPAYSPQWAEAGSAGESLLQAAGTWLVPVAGTGAPGDVVLFRWRDGAPVKHAGLLSETGGLIHAYERAGVIESPLVPAWSRRISHVFSFPGVLPWQP